MIEKNFNLLRWFTFFYEFRPYMAISALYFSHVSGSYALGFAIFSIAAIASSVFEIPTGIFSDRIGRKKTVILGASASFLAIATYALANSFAILAVGAVINGLARALISGNNNALLYDSLKQQGKISVFPEKLGKVNAIIEVGLGISALLAGVIALHSLKLVMIASVLPQLIGIFIALRLIEPKIHTDKISENIFSHLKEAWSAFNKNIKLRKVSTAYILDNALDLIIYDLKPAFNALLWPTWALGIARALDSVFGFIGFHYAGTIVKRLGASRTLFIQHLAGTANKLIFIAFPNILSPFMLTLNSFAYGLSETGNQTLLHKEFTDKQRATMGSLNALASSLCYAILAFAIGYFADQIGIVSTLVLVSLLSVAAIPIYWNIVKKHSNEEK